MLATPSTLSAQSPQQLTVLIVDDYEDNRDVLRIILQRQGIKVIEATDGVEAIKMALVNLPDLILMDISMPVMDGLDSIRQLKGVEVTRSIPVVVVSAHCGDPSLNKKAMDAGCIRCVPKPFELQEITAILAGIEPRNATA